jgi:hypothetical protein
MFDELDLYLDATDNNGSDTYSDSESEPEPHLSREEAVKALRAWFEEKDASKSTVFTSVATFSDITDATLVRWFDSRGQSLDKTKMALTRHLQWREEVKLNSITKESVLEELASDFIVFGGPDTDDYPCVFAFVRNHDKDTATKEGMQRLIIYLLEEALRKCEEGRKAIVEQGQGGGNYNPQQEQGQEQGQEGGKRRYTDQFTLVFDLWGFGLKNMNYDAISTLVQTARYNYPHVIRRVLIVNAPWVFGACYKIIERFLPDDAREIIGFANNYDEISKYIALERLPEQTIFAIDDEGDVDEDGGEGGEG